MAITDSVNIKKSPQSPIWTTKAEPPVVERSRLQLDFTPQALEDINRMKVKAKVKSTAELARNALRLYEWYLEKQEQGYELLLAKGGEVKQVELLL